MFRKRDVRLSAEGGIELSAWLFVPEERTGRLPAITKAHGHAALVLKKRAALASP
jgi:cephalosporin-C deacetylase-like acetyl esterase